MDAPNYSVKTLQSQVFWELIICMGLFILTEVVSAIFCPYWRPVGYSIGWIVLAVIIGALGLIGVHKKSSGALICFNVLLIMLACLNISHTLTMRSEHVHTCKLTQLSFRGCNTVASLKKCLPTNDCTRDQMQGTICNAPGKEHCANLNHMNWVFAFNMLISFLTFSEPAFWGILLLLRMEMTFPITPDEDDKEEDENAEAQPLVADQAKLSSDKLNTAAGSGSGAGNGGYLANYGANGKQAWV